MRLRSSATSAPGRRAAIHASVASSASTTPALAEHSGRHVGQGRALVGRQRRQPGTAELHHAIERELLLGVVGQDEQHDVLGRDAGTQLAGELEADRLRHDDERETGVDERRVLGGADA